MLRSKFTVEAEREHALNCVRMAQETVEPTTKALLLEMARLWMGRGDARQADIGLPAPVVMAGGGPHQRTIAG